MPINPTMPNDQYVAKDGTCCPVCQENAFFDFDTITVSDGVATQTVNCQACGSQWEDVYELDRYHLHHAGDKHAMSCELFDRYFGHPTGHATHTKANWRAAVQGGCEQGYGDWLYNQLHPVNL